MSITGLDVFDRTVHKTNSWLKEIMQELNCEDRHKAYLALRVTLHALRDRITIEQVAELAAQLPMLIRGFYYERWDPTAKPLRLRTKEEFLARIQEELRTDFEIDPERIARTVFGVLERRVAEGEIEDVEHMLPKKIRELWPQQGRAA
jgi:uncharacterized protein (DUF2267 family)